VPGDLMPPIYGDGKGNSKQVCFHTADRRWINFAWPDFQNQAKYVIFLLFLSALLISIYKL
jgi:hypothetical protein